MHPLANCTAPFPATSVGHMASHADWGALHVDLLSTVLGTLSKLCHEAAGGALGVADAARLLASCSPNRHWRSIALAQAS